LGAAWRSGIEPVGLATELGSGLGLLAGAILLLQMLSSGRFEGLSGRIGIDRSKSFHRLAGAAVLLIAAVHPLAYLLSTGLDDPSAVWPRLASFVTGQSTRSGLIAFFALAALVLLPLVRERLGLSYEAWRATHGLLAISAAGLVLHHGITTGSYSGERLVLLAWAVLAALALGALVLMYVARPLRMWHEPWRVERVTADGEGSWRLELLGPSATTLRFAPGQFIWMTLSPHWPVFHDHPFSIASAEADLPSLRLIVRKAGNCTNKFGSIEPGTRVAIDGPHGSFVLDESGERVLMVAGGVGIAPLLGMLEHAARAGDQRRFRLIYAGRHPTAFAAIDRIEALAKVLDLKTTLVADEPSGTAGFLPGPLDAAFVMAAMGDPSRTVAYVCGPPGMMAMATDAVISGGMSPERVHYERFDDMAHGGRLDRRRLRQSIAVLAVALAAVAVFTLR
jgi:predicted ferric reductase